MSFSRTKLTGKRPDSAQIMLGRSRDDLNIDENDMEGNEIKRIAWQGRQLGLRLNQSYEDCNKSFKSNILPPKQSA